MMARESLVLESYVLWLLLLFLLVLGALSRASVLVR